jgi:hypothetical protein
MSKKTGIGLTGLVVLVFILFVAQGQTEEQGWKKTVTLPNGEVVCDLNGKWDSEWNGKGELKFLGRIVEWERRIKISGSHRRCSGNISTRQFL